MLAPAGNVKSIHDQIPPAQVNSAAPRSEFRRIRAGISQIILGRATALNEAFHRMIVNLADYDLSVRSGSKNGESNERDESRKCMRLG